MQLISLATPPCGCSRCRHSARRRLQVLVFSKTAGFRHGTIPLAKTLIEQLAAGNNFEAEFSEDASVFDPARAEVPACCDAVVFNSTTVDALDAGQQATFETYVRGGGGFAADHSATDTE